MKYKTLLFLLIVFSTLGQLEEIKKQDVLMGGYIKQNCIVNSKGATGLDNYIPCPDCSAYMSISDLNGNYILNNKLATNLGLSTLGYTYNNYEFGYKANPSELQSDKKYNFVTLCISPSKGNGSIQGEFTITSAQVKPSADSGGILGGFWDEALDFVNVKLYNSCYNSLICRGVIIDWFGALLKLLVGLGGIINAVLTFIGVLTDIALKVFMFIGINPDANNHDYDNKIGAVNFTNNVIIPYVVGLIISFITANFLVFMALESLFMGLALIQCPNDGLIMVSKFYDYNFKTMLLIKDLFIWLISFVKPITDLGIGLLRTLNII